MAALLFQTVDSMTGSVLQGSKDLDVVGEAVEETFKKAQTTDLPTIE
jgi:hypothetical protein